MWSIRHAASSDEMFGRDPVMFFMMKGLLLNLSVAGASDGAKRMLSSTLSAPVALVCSWEIHLCPDREDVLGMLSLDLRYIGGSMILLMRQELFAVQLAPL